MFLPEVRAALTAAAHAPGRAGTSSCIDPGIHAPEHNLPTTLKAPGAGVETTPVEQLPVLVVGAGPVGLALATVLEHHGVRCRIVDRADAPAPLSKAAGIQARTLEILDELRLATAFVERGVRLTSTEVREDGEVIAAVDDGTIATESRFPFLLGLPQATTEELLTERLRERGVEVERGVELAELRQDERGVHAILRDRDGATETVECHWLAGCDGPQSTVRSALRIPFQGGEHRASYALGDVELAWDRAPDSAMLLLQEHGSMQLFPIGTTRWRLAVDCGHLRAEGRPVPPTPDDLQDFCDAYLPIPARVGEVHWSTYYCVHHRHAARFRARRVFLLGDAAHVHSPLTFQGLNAGIQDAWNLGWKLAQAEHGWSTDRLLDSYDAERREVDVHLTRDSGQVDRLFPLRNPITRHLEDVLLPFVAALPGYERYMGRRTAQPAYGYRSSPAVGRHLDARVTRVGYEPKVHPGDLAPDAPFTTDAGARIRDGRSYVSLVFTGDAAGEAELEPVVSLRLPGRPLIRTVLVTKVPGLRARRSGTSIVSDSGGGIHRAWDVTEPTHVLVRPDGYVAWRATPPDGDAVARFLGSLHGAGTPDSTIPFSAR
jgi:2-polyprenyl-6-methoxyphenol hydroxylase-like FAD-dependent oxidoreductase